MDATLIGSAERGSMIYKYVSTSEETFIVNSLLEVYLYVNSIVFTLNGIGGKHLNTSKATQKREY